METLDPNDTPAAPVSRFEGPPQAPMSAARQAVRRVRWAMYGSFGALALLVLVLSWAIQRAGPGNSRSLVLAAGAAVLVLMALLAWGLIEPAVQFVRHQHRQVARQAGHLGQLAQVARHSGRMVIISDRQDRILWVNEAFTAMSGWSLGQARGRYPGELMYSPHADTEALARLGLAIERGEAVHLELRNRNRDGHDLWLDIDIQPLRSGSGKTTGFINVSTDITAQMDERAKTQTVLAVLPTGVLVQAANGRITEVNAAAEILLGLSRETLINSPAPTAPLELIREDGSPCPNDDLPPIKTLRTGQPVRGATLGLRGRDGDIRWMRVDTAPLHDALGEPAGVATCFIDITERRRLEQRLADSAQIDALTQLPNRAVTLGRVRRAIDHAARNPGYGFAVLFMDFDRFMQVNDSLGHAAGDELLRQVSRRLQETLRPGDAVARVAALPELQPQTAARFGGDEFVVVLEGVTDAEQVNVIASRLLEQLALPYTVFGSPVQSSVSMGIVTSAHAAATAEEVLRDADTAMYEAKRSGGGRIVMFEGAMRERLVLELAIETELRRALLERELFVVYMPVVNLHDGKMTGVEALVRWKHPQRGVVPPAQFIPVAEETGLIGELGEFVLAQACGQFVRWREMHDPRAPRQLSVNLSAAQLSQPGLVQSVHNILLGCGMAPAELQLEVTESFAAKDQHSLATLKLLKGLGVSLALDDFGTGYSSLSCLHELPVDSVKIDRAFVNQASSVEYHRVLIKAIISMCRALDIGIVAEGIETVEQSVLMEELGCDRGQGFLYARPMAADKLLQWSARAR